MQVQSLLHVLCDETELAELELKVCHCILYIHTRILASGKHLNHTVIVTVGVVHI